MDRCRHFSSIIVCSWLVAVAAAPGGNAAADDNVATQIAVIAKAGPQGAGSVAARQARDDLANRGIEILPQLLAAMNTSNVVADDKGIATCFDSATGKLLWRKRLEGRFTASPVAASGKLFFTSESGSTLVVDATSPDYVELSRNEIGEDVYASAAISQGRLFLRTAKSLICVGTK